MKARTFLSIISITLALALVVGGLTLAWFNDEAVPPEIGRASCWEIFSKDV